MNNSNEHPSRRELLGLAVGTVSVAGLAWSAPARAGPDGINTLIAVTQLKAQEAAAEAAALEAADKERSLLRRGEGAVSQMSELDARRIRSQARLNGYLREIAGNLARMKESSGVC